MKIWYVKCYYNVNSNFQYKTTKYCRTQYKYIYKRLHLNKESLFLIDNSKNAIYFMLYKLGTATSYALFIVCVGIIYLKVICCYTKYKYFDCSFVLIFLLHVVWNKQKNVQIF